MKTIVSFLSFLLFSVCSNAQLDVRIAQGDIEVCNGHFADLSATTVSGTPTSYTWSCDKATFSSTTKKNTRAIFSTISNTYVTYLYLEAQNATETSLDSVKVTIKALPSILLSEETWCDNAGNIDLKEEIVLSPAVYLGTPSWDCIDCNGNNFDSMLIDEGVAGITDYKLRVGPDHYSFKNLLKDTIYLEFKYVNERSCTNYDTVPLEIVRTPKLTLDNTNDLCWNDGEIDLNDWSGVNYKGGTWSCVDESGYASCSELGGFVDDTINTMNSRPNGGVYLLRYIHTSSGCQVSFDTPIKINPTPAVNIDALKRNPPHYCEDINAIPLDASPVGGAWTASEPTALVNGNRFSPSSAGVVNERIYFYYSYTNPVTGCIGVDSVWAIVEPFPQLEVPNDTNFFRHYNQSQVQLNFDIEAQYHGGLDYYKTNVFANSDKYEFSSSSDSSVTVDLNFTKDTIEIFRVIVLATSTGSCSDVDNHFDIIAYPPHPVSVEPILIADAAEIYPNPNNGAFKLGKLNPNDYTVTVVSKHGQILDELEADEFNTYHWNEKGLFVLWIQSKEGDASFTLRMLVL